MTEGQGTQANLVNVRDPATGQAGSIPTEQLQDAINAGYAPLTNEEYQQEKYGSIGQQAIAGLEGAGVGFTFGLSTQLEKEFGIPEEEIVARRKANPITHGIGEAVGLGASSFIPMLGEANLLDQAGIHAASLFAQGADGIGAKILEKSIHSAIGAALFQGGDEVSKLLSHDPQASMESAIANVGLSGLFGSILGAGLGKVSPLWEAANSVKYDDIMDGFVARAKQYGEMNDLEGFSNDLHPSHPNTFPQIRPEEPTQEMSVEDILHGIPSEETPGIKPNLSEDNAGAKLFDVMTKFSGRAIGAVIGGAIGHQLGLGTIGALAGEHFMGEMFESVFPGIMRALIEAHPSGIGLKAAVDYGVEVLQGQKLLNMAVKSIFKTAEDIIPAKLAPTVKAKAKLDDLIKSSSENPENMLSLGGQLGHYLGPHAVALSYTAQRAVNYLTALRPNPQPAAPLDSVAVISKMQRDAYDNALAIAQQPLSILPKIKNGSITQTDIGHLIGLYPSLYGQMRNKIFNEMTTHISKDNKIPYETRLGLSLFLGQPLDSTMTPMSIRLAQSKPMQSMGQQAPRGSKSSPALGKMSRNWMTPQQHREMSRNSKL